MHGFLLWVVELVGDMGYLGLFVMMFLESSFIPFPSEIAMIPAGYLVYRGEINLILAVLSGTLGSLAGAFFNYYLACRFGREFLLAYGRYVRFDSKTLESMEIFFAKYGDIAIFVGRLIPVVRQYISLPAGVAKMPLLRFALFTSMGAGIWVFALTMLGYYLGGIMEHSTSLENLIAIFVGDDTTSPQSLYVRAYMHQLLALSLGIGVVSVGLYCLFKFSHKSNK